MLLTMGPATTDHLDPQTVNDHFDIIAFQMYSSNSLPGQFVNCGIDPAAFAYGVSFEAAVLTADQAFAEMQEYGFKAVTTWRLNSGNYIYEQDQYAALAKLVKG